VRIRGEEGLREIANAVVKAGMGYRRGSTPGSPTAIRHFLVLFSILSANRQSSLEGWEPAGSLHHDGDGETFLDAISNIFVLQMGDCIVPF
jgi:hypothetical protein